MIVCGLYVVLWGKSKEMKKMNQLVPSQCPHESDTVEVIVRSRVEDKSNHNNINNHDNAANVVRDNEDSSENGRDEHGRQIHNKGRREEGEEDEDEEEISPNASHA